LLHVTSEAYQHMRSCFVLCVVVVAIAVLATGQALAPDVRRGLALTPLDEVEAALRTDGVLANAAVLGSDLTSIYASLLASGPPPPEVFLLNTVVYGDLLLARLGTRSSISVEEEGYWLGEELPWIREGTSVTRVETPVGLLNCSITGAVVLGDGVVYSSGILIRNCDLASVVGLRLVLMGGLSLWDCQIGPGGIEITQALVMGSMDLLDVSVDSTLDVSSCVFGDWFRVRNSVIEGEALLLSNRYLGLTDLAHSQFLGVVDAAWSEFYGHISLDGCRLAGGAHLGTSRFHEQEQRIEMFRLAYRGWEAVGNLRFADQYYKQYRRLLRKTKPFMARLAETVLLDWPSAYGTSWVRVLASWLCVILLSTLVFWIGAGIVDEKTGRRTRSIWRSLYFSIVTFTTLGYGDYRPRPGFFRAVAVVTAALGVILAAILVLVFSRAAMR